MTTQQIKNLLLPYALLSLAGLPVLAQEGGIRIKLKAEPSAPIVKEQRNLELRNKPPVKSGPAFTRTTGALSVVSEPLATIFLQPVGATKFIDKEELPANQSQAIFASLKPGKYKVVAELDGYEAATGEVAVIPNQVQRFELRLKPELYTVTVETNVAAGDVKYRLSKGAETPRFVRIANGIAKISGLRAGEYEVDIKADDAAYKTILAAIEVGKGKIKFPVTLQYALCEQVFSESWVNLSGWDAPSDWRAANRKLRINSPGIALPKDDCPRNFADFELTTNVKMLNDQGIAFVARAQDKKNYYLIHLTGAKAAEPLMLRGTAYVDGKPQAMGRSIPLDAFAVNMTGKYFTVVIKAKGNVFEVFINDSDTGDELPLGKLPDPSKHFALGAIGIAASGAEQNEVERFHVKPMKR